jgi:hypothetical protein
MTIFDAIIGLALFFTILVAWIYAVICNDRLRRKIRNLRDDLALTKIEEEFYRRLSGKFHEMWMTLVREKNRKLWETDADKFNDWVRSLRAKRTAEHEDPRQ